MVLMRELYEVPDGHFFLRQLEDVACVPICDRHDPDNN